MEKKMYRAFLIKYSEIGIKGKNRYVFENILKENIRKALEALMPGYVISKEQGRVFVECPEGYDYEDTIEALKKVFGIAGICPVVVIEDIEWENLKQNYKWKSFLPYNYTLKFYILDY